MTKSFLYDWKFWLGLAIVILLIFIVLCNVRNYNDPNWKSEHKHNRKEIEVQPTQIESLVVMPTVEPTPIPIPTPTPTPVVQSRVDYVTDPFFVLLSSREGTPSVYNTAKVGGHIDITPSLPPGLVPEGERPGERPDDSRDSKGERECRRALEKIYGVRFDKMPHTHAFKGFYNDRTQIGMELDGISWEAGRRYGYNAIAFEYNGEFHYKSNHFFHKSFQSFLDVAYKDERKMSLCDQYRVYLITIPYHVKLRDIETYIRYYLPENVTARKHTARH